MGTLDLYSRWIDGSEIEPPDGLQVLAYTLIENPELETPLFKKCLIKHGDLTLSGPTVRTYQKKFVDDGVHRKVAFWQAIEV